MRSVSSVCIDAADSGGGSRIGGISLMTENTYKTGRERRRRRGEEERTGGEGGYDDRAVGGGLVDGVMCCFRASCFCDSGIASSIAIGYQ